MPISATKRKSNKKNAQKSTGPRTAAGKNAVRFNSVTHGATAKTPVLPWEEQALFDKRILGYKTWVQPEGDLENSIVEELTLASWQLERATLSNVARVTFNIHTARAEELRLAQHEAAALGQRLFFDQHGPLPLHPRSEFEAREPRTVWSKTADDPDHPSRLVMSLEATRAGCRWLLDRWTELRDRLESGECWHAPEKLKAVRLLGKLPYDAADEREVTQIYLCCHVIDPRERDDPFFEIASDMEKTDYKRFRERLARRNVESMRPADSVAARAHLLDLVDWKIDRLNTLADQRLAFDDAMNALKTDIMGFDDSDEGERLRRHAATCQRAMHRAIATIIKMRKDLPPPELDLIEDRRLPREAGTGEPAIEDRYSAIENGEPLAATVNDENRETPDQLAVFELRTESQTAETVNRQSKATDAGDATQVQAAVDVQEPEMNAANSENLAVEDKPAAVELEQDEQIHAAAVDDEHELPNWPAEDTIVPAPDHEPTVESTCPQVEVATRNEEPTASETKAMGPGANDSQRAVPDLTGVLSRAAWERITALAARKRREDRQNRREMNDGGECDRAKCDKDYAKFVAGIEAYINLPSSLSEMRRSIRERTESPGPSQDPRAEFGCAESPETV